MTFKGPFQPKPFYHSVISGLLGSDFPTRSNWENIFYREGGQTLSGDWQGGAVARGCSLSDNAGSQEPHPGWPNLHCSTFF